MASIAIRTITSHRPRPADVTRAITARQGAETVDALPDDVDQALGYTCSFMSALASFARNRSDIASRINYDQATNQYRVPMFVNDHMVNVAVNFNGSWTDNDPSPGPAAADGRRDYWTLIYQRAFLQALNVDTSSNDASRWAVRGTDASQVTLQNWRYPAIALTTLTGRPAAIGTNLTDYEKQLLEDALHSGQDVIANTWTTPEHQAATQNAGLVYSHAYTVVNVGTDNSGGFVVLRNPWGIDAPAGAGNSWSTADRVAFTIGNESDGYVKVSLEHIQADVSDGRRGIRVSPRSSRRALPSKTRVAAKQSFDHNFSRHPADHAVRQFDLQPAVPLEQTANLGASRQWRIQTRRIFVRITTTQDGFHTNDDHGHGFIESPSLPFDRAGDRKPHTEHRRKDPSPAMHPMAGRRQRSTGDAECQRQPSKPVGPPQRSRAQFQIGIANSISSLGERGAQFSVAWIGCEPTTQIGYFACETVSTSFGGGLGLNCELHSHRIRRLISPARWQDRRIEIHELEYGNLRHLAGASPQAIAKSPARRRAVRECIIEIIHGEESERVQLSECGPYDLVEITGADDLQGQRERLFDRDLARLDRHGDDEWPADRAGEIHRPADNRRLHTDNRTEPQGHRAHREYKKSAFIVAFFSVFSVPLWFKFFFIISPIRKLRRWRRSFRAELRLPSGGDSGRRSIQVGAGIIGRQGGQLAVVG